MPLTSFVNNQVPEDTDLPLELPLIHSTRCEIVRTISKGAPYLIPQICQGFNEPLLYLFYGRPAYRSQTGDRPSTSADLCPVCLIFKPYTILRDEIVGILPFDSGAANDGLFAPNISKETLSGYSLVPPTLEIARRATKAFFETNQNYFLGVPKPDLVIPPTEAEAKLYYSLIVSQGEVNYDDRRSAIEVRTSNRIPLQDTLLAVILPSTFLAEKPVWKAVMEQWRTLTIAYPTFAGSMPLEYNAVIRDRLYELLFQKSGSYT